MIDLIERARRYVEKLDPAVSGSNGHAATYHVAVVLVQGFCLDESSAWLLLNEYNARCAPAWSEKELRHKMRQAHKAHSKFGRGWLVKASDWKPNERARNELSHALPPEVPRAKFVPDSLAKFARPMTGVVDLLWLANRSWIDPAMVSTADFFAELYDKEREKVLVFSKTNAKGMPVSQGEAVWPDDDMPKTGRHGVWYLAAPVDGKWRETGEKDADGNAKLSRRNGQCVMSWRWMVIESDEAPLKEWLAAIARIPLRIAALYTSGGRSVHALIKTGARTKQEWDDFRDEIKPALVTLGADPGCMSAVRLTRLPGAMREGKTGKDGVYQRFPQGMLQKLLYFDPRADGRPISELPVLRNVVADWCKLAMGGVADSDETRGQWIADGLSYYAPRSGEIREMLAKFEVERLQ